MLEGWPSNSPRANVYPYFSHEIWIFIKIGPSSRLKLTSQFAVPNESSISSLPLPFSSPTFYVFYLKLLLSKSAWWLWIPTSVGIIPILVHPLRCPHFLGLQRSEFTMAIRSFLSGSLPRAGQGSVVDVAGSWGIAEMSKVQFTR